MKLLLADDDADQTALRSMNLARSGHDVRTAGDVDSALRVAAETLPDAAVVDLKLPTEDAGLRLIRGLKALDATIRIIVLTGADPKRMESFPERLLVEAVFTKGCASKQLAQHLKDMQQTVLRAKLQAAGQMTIAVKVVPRSTVSEVLEYLPDGTLKVKLAAVPDKGRANQELITVLADYFDIRKDGIELLTGETSQRKRLSLRAT
jgi:uncharacterized protein YggU (UPF0235/DUF167 family)